MAVLREQMEQTIWISMAFLDQIVKHEIKLQLLIL